MRESEVYGAIREESLKFTDSVGQLIGDTVAQCASLVNVVSEDGFRVALDARNMGAAMLEGMLHATQEALETMAEDNGDDSKGPQGKA